MKSIIKTNQPEVGHGIGIFDPTNCIIRTVSVQRTLALMLQQLSGSLQNKNCLIKSIHMHNFRHLLFCKDPENRCRLHLMHNKVTSGHVCSHLATSE